MGVRRSLAAFPRTFERWRLYPIVPCLTEGEFTFSAGWAGVTFNLRDLHFGACCWRLFTRTRAANISAESPFSFLPSSGLAPAARISRKAS